MTIRQFEAVVRKAFESLPEKFREKLKNVAWIVRESPGRCQSGMGSLLGLYEGVPFGEQGGEYCGTYPGRITIYKRPIERQCRTREEIIRCIQETVLHEVGHHFGFGDKELEELGY